MNMKTSPSSSSSWGLLWDYNHATPIRPFPVLWALIKANLISLWTFQQIVIYSEERCFRLRWPFGMSWSIHYLQIQFYGGRILYQTPHLTKLELFNKVARMDYSMSQMRDLMKREIEARVKNPKDSK